MTSRLHQEPGIPQYIAYTASFHASRALVQATVLLYLVDVLHMPLAQTSYLLAVDLAVSLLMEVPTGLFADLRGRRRSFLIACALSLLGIVIYGAPLFLELGPHTALVWALVAAGEAVLSASFAFYSGALDAWIIDSLKAHQSSAERGRVLAWGQLAKNVAFLAAGLIGILVYFRYSGSRALNSFSLAAAAMAITLLHASLYMLPQVDAMRNRPVPALQRDALWAGLRSALRQPRLLDLILLSALSMTLLQLLVHFWPYFLSRGQGDVSQASTPSSSMSGLMLSWALAYGARALGNACSSRGAFGHSDHGSIFGLLAAGVGIGAALLIGLCLVALLAPSWTAVGTWAMGASLVYAAVRFFDGLAEPLRLQLLTDHTTEDHRATLYSIASFAGMAASSVAAVAAGVVLDQGVGIAQIWLTAALLQLLSAPAYVALSRKAR